MLTNELKENIKIKEGINTSNDSQNSDLNNNNNIQNDFEKVDIYYKRSSKSLSNKYKSKQKMQFKNSESFTNEDEDFYKINRPRIHTHNNKIDKNDKIKKRGNIRKKRRKFTLEQNNERNLCIGCVGCNIF